MFSTVIVVATFLTLLAIHMVLWTALLRIGLRWARISDVTRRRLVVTLVSVLTGEVIISVVLQLLTPASESQSLLRSGVGLAVAVLVPCAIISRVFSASALRSFQAWIPTLLAPITMVLFTYFLIRPFVCEAFRISSNSMAPTLVGTSWRSTCPECGERSYCSPMDTRNPESKSPLMICGNFHILEGANIAIHANQPDRAIVAKFLEPQRWDVVVFQLPSDPSTLFAKRLVGLPGERLQIEDGAVWINGQKLELPSQLSGLKYREIPNWTGELWGSNGEPVVLGEDEYFVLGDFSPQSMDSRLWETGAAGHPAFAVPKSHLRGVVTHIYWPPERWRILR